MTRRIIALVIAATALMTACGKTAPKATPSSGSPSASTSASPSASPSKSAAPTTSSKPPTTKPVTTKPATGKGAIQVHIYAESSGNLFDEEICAAVFRASDNKMIDTTMDIPEPLFKVAPGKYKVRMKSCDELDGEYEVEWWKDKATRAEATVVTVVSGKTVDVSAHLAKAGYITGKLTIAGGAPADPICAFAYFPNKEQSIDYAMSEYDGTYRITTLRAGSYRVKFDDCPGQGGTNWTEEWYAGGTSFATATSVAVTVGATTSGIDAEVASG